MPIINFQRLGDWEPEKQTDPGAKPSAYDRRKSAKKGYYKDDFGILTSDAGVEKIKRRWSKCQEPFNTFFLRSKEGAKQREVGEVGVEFLTNTLKLPPDQVQAINNPSAINIVYTNNMGAERQPMNWWTMAHRLGHAIKNIPQFKDYVNNLNYGFYQILDQVFNFQKKRENFYSGYGERRSSGPRNDQMLLALANSVCTFRSARERQIRNIFELYYEIIAQYIIQGGVKFNPIPKSLITGFTYGRPQHHSAHRDLDTDQIEGWTDYLTDHLAPETDSYIARTLNACMGKIFVM